MFFFLVRRSGRLSKIRKGNQDNGDYEVIDLTTPEWNNAGEGIHFE